VAALSVGEAVGLGGEVGEIELMGVDGVGSLGIDDGVVGPGL